MWISQLSVLPPRGAYSHIRNGLPGNQLGVKSQGNYFQHGPLKWHINRLENFLVIYWPLLHKTQTVLSRLSWHPKELFSNICMLSNDPRASKLYFWQNKETLKYNMPNPGA